MNRREVPQIACRLGPYENVNTMGGTGSVHLQEGDGTSCSEISTIMYVLYM